MNERLQQVTQELAAVLADKEELTMRENTLKAEIRSLVPGPDKYSVGDATLVVSTNNRFDTTKALNLIPEALLPLVTYPTTTVDRDKLRVLAPEVFEAAQTHGDYRVSIR